MCDADSEKCHLLGLNQGPSDLQSDALPTELKRLQSDVLPTEGLLPHPLGVNIAPLLGAGLATDLLHEIMMRVHIKLARRKRRSRSQKVRDLLC